MNSTRFLPFVVFTAMLASCTGNTAASSSQESNLEESVSSEADSSIFSSEEAAPKKLELISIEMKKNYADSTLIKYGDFEILVDGGEKGDDPQIKDVLDRYVTDRHLDMIIVSHPHSDHVGGISTMVPFKNIDTVGTILDTGYNYAVFQSFTNNVINHYVPLGTEHYSIAEWMTHPELVNYQIDENLSLNFLKTQFYTAADSTGDINKTSIAMYLKFHNTIVFMAGDSPSATENSIMTLNSSFTTQDNIVLYKGSHHGSKGANSASFLQWIKPDYCWVSAAITAKGSLPNLSQHPYAEAVDRIAKHTKDIYWNAITGNLHMTIDGTSPITFEGEGRTVDYKIRNADGEQIVVDRESEKNCTYLNSQYWAYGVANAHYTDYSNQ